MNKPLLPPAPPFASYLPALGPLVLIFFLNFTSRILISPLGVPIQNDLGASAAAVGSLFFYTAIGAAISMISSSLVTSRLSHRRTILLSTFALAGPLLFAAGSDSVGGLAASCFCLGLVAGVYVPSGMALVTTIAPPAHWGKALAVHELAPTTGFVLAPVLAELALAFSGWRLVLVIQAVLTTGAALIFLARGRGGEFTGRAPDLALLSRVVRRPAFAILVLVIGLAMGATMAPYGMLPLYLVHEHGYLRPQANQLLALSRFSGVPMVFLAGFLADRLGTRTTMALSLAAMGLLTVGLGLGRGNLLLAAVLLQPLVSVCFFPAGYATIAQLFEPELRSLAMSLVSPLAVAMGLGLIPYGIGILADAGHFSAAFVSLGIAVLASLAVLSRLERHTPARLDTERCRN